MNADPTFYIEIDAGHPLEAEAHIREAASAVVAAVYPLPPQGKPWACTFRLSDDSSVRALNKSYRDKDKPTNVLSFPADESMQAPDEPYYLGDIIFAAETVRKEASAQKKTFENHLKHLAVHGLLHIYGYDHIRDEDADMMEKLEINVLAALNIESPY